MNRKRVAVVAFCLLAVAVASVAYLLRDPSPRFLARRSRLASVVEDPPQIRAGSSFQRVTLTAESGLSVELAVRRVLGDSGRRLPVVVILGGHLTGAAAAELVGETPGVAVAAMSYPFTGNPRPGTATFIREIPQIRAAFLDTPPALMLVADYLDRRPDIDRHGIEAVGVSLGAPFVTIAAALDTRFRRVWAMHGSGGSYAPLEASMRQTVAFAPARKLGAAVASVIIAGPRLAPERWARRISPRPFIMVNATDDERLPRRSVDALYHGAAHPKERIWMSGRHIRGDAETIGRLVRLVLDRIARGEPVPSAS